LLIAFLCFLLRIAWFASDRGGRTMIINKNFGQPARPLMSNELLKWEAVLLYAKLDRLEHDFAAFAERLDQLKRFQDEESFETECQTCSQADEQR
jgi:hypothetical protein